MSINDFSNKIKGKLGIDNFLLVCFSIIVLVGLSSFGLGRLSVTNREDSSSLNTKGEGMDIVSNNDSEDKEVKGVIVENTSIVKERMFVASKNGKLYYKIGCSGAKRISPKNEVWFASALDAEKSGYQLSSSCK